ncbi:hypothetical protein ACH3VR_21090 [Microbacterium sp. B2969]|uniref:DUF3137 domain-containing protein n=1 Tax=Microbacterium alkaliflavum TaxID=3248839 RepID=A0ABW7QDA6_9MICO
MSAFDARPLTEPVDRRAARDFARRLRTDGRVAKLFGSSTIVAIVVGGFIAVVFGGMFLSVFVSILTSFLSSGGEDAWIGVLVFLVPLVVIGLVAPLAIFGFVRGISGQNVRWYRLDGFARANGMSYVPVLANPALPGMLFGVGSGRQASDLVRGEKPRFAEFANYRYTTGSGKNRTTHTWGYVAVKLDVPLPNIVLDAKGNNSLFGTNLPATFDAHQRLSLEGDFDEHFALYCPEGYERDALYLFTPDIMARFVDHAAALDVEIVDDWLFLYAKRDVSTLDPATWAWLFSIVGALLDKLAQWGRWRDERLVAAPTAEATSLAASGSRTQASPFATSAALLRPPPGVARQGRRLTRRVSWGSIVAGVALIVFWILSQTGVLDLIFR